MDNKGLNLVINSLPIAPNCCEKLPEKDPTAFPWEFMFSEF